MKIRLLGTGTILFALVVLGQGAPKAVFQLADPGTERVIDYEKYGAFPGQAPMITTI